MGVDTLDAGEPGCGVDRSISIGTAEDFPAFADCDEVRPNFRSVSDTLMQIKTFYRIDEYKQQSCCTQGRDQPPVSDLCE